ncbi:MAG TPA: class I SAM-dependent methyltransferase [Thermoanaerobaculia bacterium]|jgi:SAM-dependent methyltransferase
MTARSDLVRALAHVEFTRATPAAAEGLLPFFADPTVDWQDLARPAASLLLRDDADERLLHAYLRHCINISYALEQRFIALCRDARGKLAASLAIQHFLNGQVWPESPRAELDDEELVRITIDEPAEERAIAASLRAEEPADAVTAAVRAQYEEHPYPRWLTFHHPVPIEGEPPRRVLVAGCGTGRDVLRLAMAHPRWSIDAIDLSRASLAYAIRKARELGVANVNFRLADLRFVGGTYDGIIAVGVLHHLASIEEGLRALRRCLAPDGELLAGLYSRRGRASLAPLRALAGDVAPDADSLRAARQRMLAQLRGDALREVEDLDFFELGHFRDTLFHAHEIELTPRDLGEVIARAGFRFAGFEELPADVARQHGGELDLEVWDAIEQERPELFRHLFRCRLRCA